MSSKDGQRSRRLGAALDRHRRAQQRTIRDVATRAGVGYETVRAVLAGRSKGPSFFLIAKLAVALDVSLDELFVDSMQ